MAENNNEVLKKARKELDYLTGDEAVRRLAELRDKWEMDDFFIKKRAKYKERVRLKNFLLLHKLLTILFTFSTIRI